MAMTAIAGEGEESIWIGGMILMAVGAGLFLLCIVSTLTIWWGNKSENRSFANVKRNG